MTAGSITNKINEAYGYAIINGLEETALLGDKEVIMSELGIGTILEFLSYDVSEFSDARKTIHARRFYQLFKDIFAFSHFDMEAFHKIQAGCIFVVAMSGITRGLGDYDYSGFVREALASIGTISAAGVDKATLNKKLFSLQSVFGKFSSISLGIYSLQIFTKFGMAMQNFNKAHEGYASRLMLEIIKDMNDRKPASEKIDKLLDLNTTSPDKLEVMIDDYISYAVADITVQTASPGSKRAERATKKLTEDISDEVHDAFSGMKMDIADLYNMNRSIAEKKAIYDKHYDNKDIIILFASLLERYVSLYERLWYYEGNLFIKRLNMIFISRVEEMFLSQRKQEINAIKNECIRIIESRLKVVNVYELEGILNSIELGKSEFDSSRGIDPSDSDNVLAELHRYMDANLRTAHSIQREMKNNLGRILGPEGIPEGEKKILRDVVYDFDAVMDFLMEDDL